MDDKYHWITTEMKQATRFVSPVSGRCCETVNDDGAPLCCYTLTDGTAKMEFTALELTRLDDLGPTGMTVGHDGYSVVEDVAAMAESLHSGLLASTHECAGHPTRPVVEETHGGWLVVGLATVRDCEWAHSSVDLQLEAARLIALWQMSVSMIGVKDHYVRSDQGSIQNWKGLVNVLAPGPSRWRRWRSRASSSFVGDAYRLIRRR